MAKWIALTLWKYLHYFEFVSVKHKNVSKMQFVPWQQEPMKFEKLHVKLEEAPVGMCFEKSSLCINK